MMMAMRIMSSNRTIVAQTGTTIVSSRSTLFSSSFVTGSGGRLDADGENAAEYSVDVNFYSQSITSEILHRKIRTRVKYAGRHLTAIQYNTLYNVEYLVPSWQLNSLTVEKYNTKMLESCEEEMLKKVRLEVL